MIPLVDVAIITKNSERTIERCLLSIFDNIPVNRLIIVDASEDRTIDIVRRVVRNKVPLIILHDEVESCGYARQVALELVETELFCFVDSDVILPDEWFLRLLPNMADESVAVCSGVTLFGSGTNKIVASLYYCIHMKFHLFCSSLSNSILRTQIICDLGGFGSQFRYGEDGDLAKKIESSGYKWVIDRHIITPHPRTLLEDLRAQDVWSRGTAIIEGNIRENTLNMFTRIFGIVHMQRFMRSVKYHPALFLYIPIRRLWWMFCYVKHYRTIYGGI